MARNGFPHVFTGIVFFVCAVLLLGSGPVQAQSLEETLNSLSETAGKEYVKPIVNGFGANMNGGWFHKAPSSKIFGIDFEFGMVAMGAFLDEGAQTFSTSGNFNFSQAQAMQLVSGMTFPTTTVRDAVVSQLMATPYTVGISGATAIGAEDDNIMVSFRGDDVVVGPTTYSVPVQDIDLGVGGLLNDVTMIPYAAPQFGIGTVYGTQATFRYLPDIELNEDIGSIKYFGFGIQHNPLVWVPADFVVPVDVCLSFYTQTLEVGTVFESSTTAFGLNASRDFSALIVGFRPYAGIMFEKAEMDFTYDYNVDTGAGGIVTNQVAFSLESANTNRITVGAAFKLLMLNLNIDYSIANTNTVSGGLFFAF
ncbi:DUF6588 family protein [candidate division KSB1 bacterium]